MSEIDQCRNIYRQAFGDSGDFDLRLFDMCKEYIKSYKINGVVVSMLFLLPCKMHYGGNYYNASYIYAAATDERYRGIGYMTRLLKQTCADDEMIYLLRPATNDLICFYERIGFRSIDAVKKTYGECVVFPSKEFEKLTTDMDVTEDKYTLMYKNMSYNRSQISEISFAFTME